jgi:hypothetical protein
VTGRTEPNKEIQMDFGVVFPTTQIGTDPAVIRDFAQAQHAVRALASHVGRIDVIRDQPLRYLPSLIVRGLAELPVQVRRRRPAQP